MSEESIIRLAELMGDPSLIFIMFLSFCFMSFCGAICGFQYRLLLIEKKEKKHMADTTLSDIIDHVDTLTTEIENIGRAVLELAHYIKTTHEMEDTDAIHEITFRA